MWSPGDVAAMFASCVWTTVGACMTWVGFMILLDQIFGPPLEDNPEYMGDGDE